MKKILLSILLLLGMTLPSWAVVSSTISQNEYACNSSNTSWNYTFPIILSTDIQVYTIDSMGNSTPQTTNFSVNTYTQTVTYPVTGTPCATGYSILLERIEPFTQLVAASNQGPSPSPVVMTMSDKLTMLAQQLSNNSVQSSPGTVGTVVMPPYIAGNILAWSSTLNQLANVANPSAVAQWSLSGANISYNVGNVSTTNNMTAANFNGNLNGGINWPDIPGTIPSSGINWNDINKNAMLGTGGVNWPSINSLANMNTGGVNWPSLVNAGINWTGFNIQSGGINWPDVNVNKQISNGGVTGLFGSLSDKLNNTNYQASTDGFIVGQSTTNNGGYINVYLSQTSNPSSSGILIWSYTQTGTTGQAGFCVPIPKNYYYEVAIGGTPAYIKWIPLGS